MEFYETEQKFEMTGTNYDKIFMEFMYFYGDCYPDVVKWEPYDRFSVCVYNADGTKVFYDGTSGAVKNVGKRNSKYEFADDAIYASRFAWRLKTAMNSSGLTRNEISERTGISRASLSGYFNGRVMPTAINIYKLAKVLKCSAEELINVGDLDL